MVNNFQFIFSTQILNSLTFEIIRLKVLCSGSLCNFDYDRLGCKGSYVTEQWVCCSDGAIALPHPLDSCGNDGQWKSKCYGAQQNIALNKDISSNGRNLVYGNRATSIQVEANALNSKWKIDLGRLYNVYAVVITLAQPTSRCSVDKINKIIFK